jgi:hypothetical protein
VKEAEPPTHTLARLQALQVPAEPSAVETPAVAVEEPGAVEERVEAGASKRRAKG